MAKRKRMMPTFGMVMEIPEPFFTEVAQTSSRMEAIHEKAVRAALQETLSRHWKGKFRDHFKTTARSKYDHRPRGKPYMKKKKIDFYSVTDNVKTSTLKNRTAMTIPKFTVARGDFTDMTAAGQSGKRGATNALGVTGRLSMPFPWPATAKGGVRKDGKKKVTAVEIAAELGRFTTDEMVKAANYYILRYEKHILAAIATKPTIRKRYQASMAGFGPVSTT